MMTAYLVFVMEHSSSQDMEELLCANQQLDDANLQTKKLKISLKDIQLQNVRIQSTGSFQTFIQFKISHDY